MNERTLPKDNTHSGKSTTMIRYMLRSFWMPLAWGIFLLAGSPSPGAEVGLDFTGIITFVAAAGTNGEGGISYGVRLPDFSAVAGHFVYESNTPSYPLVATGCADCSNYDHEHINGLYVEFDGLTVQADDYIIQVKNDVNVSSYGLADVITVWYPDQAIPASPVMSKPLLINGEPVTSGSFQITLVAPATTLPDSNLPASFDPSVIVPSAGIGTFGDGIPQFSLEVLFLPQSVAALTRSTSDHDLNGDVDGRDFLIWQRNVGLSTANGDANGNLVVDGEDLARWAEKYGASPEIVANVAVPEPRGIVLLAACSCVLALANRSHQ